MTYRVFILINGNKVMGRVNEHNEKSITIKNPKALIFHHTQADTLIQFVKLNEGGDEEDIFYMNPKLVLGEYIPSEKLIRFYEKDAPEDRRNEISVVNLAEYRKKREEQEPQPDPDAM